jgi:hypothetical protein
LRRRPDKQHEMLAAIKAHDRPLIKQDADDDSTECGPAGANRHKSLLRSRVQIPWAAESSTAVNDQHGWRTRTTLAQRNNRQTPEIKSRKYQPPPIRYP